MSIKVNHRLQLSINVHMTSQWWCSGNCACGFQWWWSFMRYIWKSIEFYKAVNGHHILKQTNFVTNSTTNYVIKALDLSVKQQGNDYKRLKLVQDPYCSSIIHLTEPKPDRRSNERRRTVGHCFLWLIIQRQVNCVSLCFHAHRLVTIMMRILWWLLWWWLWLL